MEFSWIQKHILLVLVRKPSARLKELQLSYVPANQFAYHLDGLISTKLVVKLSRGVYGLTPLGEKMAGTFSTSLGKQIEHIKTVVMLYGKRNDEYLLFRWSRQPYLGYVTPPHDQVPRGKLLEQGVLSALDDKLGSRQPVTYKTSALIKILHCGETVSHLNALIYEVPLDDVQLPDVMRNGEVFVARPNEVDRIMNGVEDFLIKLDGAPEPFDSEWYY